MSVTIDIFNPQKPRRVAMVASNPAVSGQTGWPIGFWWSELTHPYVEFIEHGYRVEIFSPDGGKLEGDNWSDPRDPGKYSAGDLITLGFICSPDHMKLVEDTQPIRNIQVSDYDAILIAGGQGPMYTFFSDDRVHELAAKFYEAGKMTGIVCHATCILLKAKLKSGKLLVDGKTWTGFANSEEAFADDYVGQKIQPFWIEEEARKIRNTNFVVSGRFKSFAVRDGDLVTGQQQFSGRAVAREIIRALGV